MEPWISYQLKRRELERQAEHYRLLSIARASRPNRPSKSSQVILAFGRGLEILGKRLQAHYDGLTEQRQIAPRLPAPTVRAQPQGDCAQ